LEIEYSLGYLACKGILPPPPNHIPKTRRAIVFHSTHYIQIEPTFWLARHISLHPTNHMTTYIPSQRNSFVSNNLPSRFDQHFQKG